jgi:hypothetical protein
MPITKVDQNFDKAYLMDSVTEQKFWWRVNGIDPTFTHINEDLNQRKFLSTNSKPVLSKEEDEANIKELTLKEIFYGSEEYGYPGILKLCYEAVELRFKDDETKSYFARFIDFIGKRTSGKKLFIYY